FFTRRTARRFSFMSLYSVVLPRPVSLRASLTVTVIGSRPFSKAVTLSGCIWENLSLLRGRVAAPSGANPAALGSKRARQQFPDCKSARQHVDLAPSPFFQIGE